MGEAKTDHVLLGLGPEKNQDINRVQPRLSANCHNGPTLRLGLELASNTGPEMSDK